MTSSTIRTCSDVAVSVLLVIEWMIAGLRCVPRRLARYPLQSKYTSNQVVLISTCSFIIIAGVLPIGMQISFTDNINHTEIKGFPHIPL